MTEVSEVIVQADKAAVWAVLTEPDLVRQWQFGAALITDWNVGSPIRFRNEWEGTVFEQWGTVLVYEAESHIRYSLFAPRPGLEDIPENYFVMDYRLEDAEGGTKLSIAQEDGRPRANGLQLKKEDGTNPVLVALKKLAESQ